MSVKKYPPIGELGISFAAGKTDNAIRTENKQVTVSIDNPSFNLKFICSDTA